MLKFLFYLCCILMISLGILLWSVINPVLAQRKGDKPTNQVDKDRLYQDVKSLVDIHPARNYLNLNSLNAAAAYIKQEFEKLDARVEEQPFEVNGATYKNIIASFGPEDAERIVIGAHYDVCGNQDGADDNASAVAGLLEVARLLDTNKPAIMEKYRLDFVAYTLEEPPFFATANMGSAVHARSLKVAEAKVKIMVCLEMIGYFSDEPNSQDFPVGFLKWFYPTTGNFIAVIGKLGQGSIVRSFKKTMQQYAAIDVRSINAPTALQGIDFSDHRNYWAEGYPALMVNNTAFYRNKNYHELTDTIETLDFDRMKEVIWGVYWGIIELK